MNQPVINIREVFRSAPGDDRVRTLQQLAETWLRTVAGRCEP